ncbi:TOBE domain-containing protein [Streptomyces sp. bgisy034]|uniref:TOBE domain-containing protein n=1 Tax=Streptomyces sp. bgisy034 TaxID=3413774 RepID=UPI003EB95C77
MKVPSRWPASRCPLPGTARTARTTARDSPHGTNDAQAGVRPEYVKIVTDPGPNTFPGSLQGVTDHGAQRVLEVEVAGQLVRTKPRAKALPYADGQLVLQS